jgi:hypothetical protein
MEVGAARSSSRSTLGRKTRRRGFFTGFPANSLTRASRPSTVQRGTGHDKLQARFHTSSVFQALFCGNALPSCSSENTTPPLSVARECEASIGENDRHTALTAMVAVQGMGAQLERWIVVPSSACALKVSGQEWLAGLLRAARRPPAQPPPARRTARADHGRRGTKPDSRARASAALPRPVWPSWPCGTVPRKCRSSAGHGQRPSPITTVPPLWHGDTLCWPTRRCFSLPTRTASRHLQSAWV